MTSDAPKPEIPGVGAPVPSPPLDRPSAESPARILDLTQDDAGEPPTAPAPPATAPFDISKEQETARATIAYLLLLLLAVTVALGFLLLWAKPYHWDKLNALMQIVFGPIVALVGAATGYYFGAASAQSNKK